MVPDLATSHHSIFLEICIYALVMYVYLRVCKANVISFMHECCQMCQTIFKFSSLSNFDKLIISLFNFLEQCITMVIEK
jgi:hypothetical protein